MGVKSVIKGENSKEKNSEDFCPNYVQEFGLRAQPSRLEAESWAPSLGSDSITDGVVKS